MPIVLKCLKGSYRSDINTDKGIRNVARHLFHGSGKSHSTFRTRAAKMQTMPGALPQVKREAAEVKQHMLHPRVKREAAEMDEHVLHPCKAQKVEVKVEVKELAGMNLVQQACWDFSVDIMRQVSVVFPLQAETQILALAIMTKWQQRRAALLDKNKVLLDKNKVATALAIVLMASKLIESHDILIPHMLKGLKKNIMLKKLERLKELKKHNRHLHAGKDMAYSELDVLSQLYKDCSALDITAAEKNVLDKLQWDIWLPTSLPFLSDLYTFMGNLSTAFNHALTEKELAAIYKDAEQNLVVVCYEYQFSDKPAQKLAAAVFLHTVREYRRMKKVDEDFCATLEEYFENILSAAEVDEDFFASLEEYFENILSAAD